MKTSSSRSSGIVVSSTLVLHWLRARRAGGSSPRACGRGGCGRSRGCARSSRARRAGCRASRRAASARPRSRTPPARLPRRGRSRRGSRSGAARTRPHSSRKTCSRVASYSLDDGRTSIAPPSRAAGIRDASSIAASRSSASKHEVAAERLLDGDERPVGRQRLAVLHAHRRRRLGRLQLEARGDAGRLVDRLVVGVDGLLLVLGEARPRLGRRAASGRRPGGSAACTSSLPPFAGWSRTRRTAHREMDTSREILCARAAPVGGSERLVETSSPQRPPRGISA